ncbi:uncharacterized protein ABDE67_020001 [Symphorus nematophorus]
MDESALERFFDRYVLSVSSGCSSSGLKGHTSLDYNSQNPAAGEAELPGGSSMPEPSVFHDCPVTPATPATPTTPVTPVMTATQQPEIVPQIHNVISTVTLGCCLDLTSIARRAWNVEYKPQAYISVTMRIREPRATALIYHTGKIVCLGTKSVEESRTAARKCARIVQKLGFPVRFLNFQVQNVVASCSTFPLSLERLAQHRRCCYEPELFPGLHWNVLPNVTATITATGKISLIGN